MSLEPIEKPSKCSRNWSASIAFDGISHIMMTRRPFSPRFRPFSASSAIDFLRLLHRAHERHHDLDVGEPHFVAHFLQRPAFELEAVAERGRYVARRAAEAQHRVLLARLVARAAGEARILVRLEVREPHDDRLGPERRAEGRDALDELLDVERHRIGVAGAVLLDRRPQVAPGDPDRPAPPAGARRSCAR